MKPDIEYVYNALKKLRFDFKESDRKLFPNEYTFDYSLDRYVRADGNDLYISKDTFKPLEEELEYADKCHNLEEQIGCPLDVVGKLRQASHIYRNDGVVFGFIGINFNDEDKLILYNDDECNIFTSDLRLADYKKTWWLKKDRSE